MKAPLGVLASWRLGVYLVVVTLTLPSFTAAQQPADAPRQQREIIGRIVDESGAPVVDAGVQFSSEGENSSVFMVSPDDEGRFRSGPLAEGLYTIWISARGYTRIETRALTLYRPGDRITIRMAKGGVITGKVSDAKGEPVIGIPVRANRVRDENGRPVERASQFESETDDRGIYRIFGLPAGGYAVSAGRTRRPWEPPSFRDSQASVYYPSSSADTASEVAVRLGAETANIDITYRAVEGRRIAGTVVGGGRNATLALRNAKNAQPVGWQSVANEGGTYRFEFTGLGDGEYEVEAFGWGDDASTRSAPKKVTIRGADVVGVELRLARLGSFEGRLVWEDGELPDGCKPPREKRERETVVALEPTAVPDEYERRAVAALKAGGDFVARNLRGGSYWIELDPPDRHWYVARIEREAAKAAQPAALGGKPLRIGQGEDLRGARVTLRGGAAAVRGRVTPAKGGKLPSGLRVVLLPVGAGAKDDPVRHYDVEVAADGTYRLEHLAPGDYLALVVRGKEAAERAPVVPLAWDEAGRVAARKEAATSSVAVTFHPCERVDALDLVY